MPPAKMLVMLHGVTKKGGPPESCNLSGGILHPGLNGGAMKPYLIYLRKSRKDRDLELRTGNFDTLQRHRDALLALARRENYTIAHIYEEVVSGDSISERPEMQKLLAAVESGEYAGVLVMEIPRLARGNTRDQGTVAEVFQYSNTKIVTPDKIYDPSDEADEEYFEFGLFMSRREYKTINRRLQRGRQASLDEGKYIAGVAPYGYRKVKIPHQKGYTLEPIPEQADVVREIYRLYTVGDPQPDGSVVPVGSYGIANELNARNIPSPGGVKWSASAVRDILKNPTYAGYLRWAYRPNKKQLVDGALVISTPINKDSPIKKGIHEPIISETTWTAARAAMSGRSHAPVPGRRQISNPLAGLLYCSVCGRSLVQLPQGSHGAPMVMCPTAKCPTVGSRLDVTEASLLDALRVWLERYKISTEAQNAAEEQDSMLSIKTAEKALSRARKGLQDLEQQKGRLFDLLEQGVYTNDVFLERSRVLANRMSEAERQEKILREHLSSLRKTELIQQSLVPKVQNVLDAYSTLGSPAEKNALLKTVLDHAVYAKTTGGRYKESDLKLYVYPKIPK